VVITCDVDLDGVIIIVGVVVFAYVDGLVLHRWFICVVVIVWNFVGYVVVLVWSIQFVSESVSE
jgi:hypothetical protein